MHRDQRLANLVCEQQPQRLADHPGILVLPSALHPDAGACGLGKVLSDCLRARLSGVKRLVILTL